MHKCENPECNKETNNPKYCSKSCAAKINNKEHPKRHKKYKRCEHCGKTLDRADRKFCDRKCYNDFKKMQTNKKDIETFVCNTHGKTKAYKKGRYLACSACEKMRQRKHYNKRKAQATEYLGGYCAHCGVDDITLLDFHHTSRKDKEYQISAKLKRFSFKRLRKELDKCILLCANCHRKEHAKIEETMEWN